MDENKIENELTKKAEVRKKRRQPKKKLVLVCVIAAIAVVGAGFGLNYLMDENRIQENAVPLSSDSLVPTVHFASYKLAAGIPLTLKAISVERDLNISILDEDGQPVTNIGFEVLVSAPDGESRIFTDEDGSGKIYLDGLEPGEYTIALQQTGRFLAPDPIQIEVKAKVEEAVIENIGELIVNAKNVDAASEDAAYGGNKNIGQNPPPPPAPLKNTIDYYPSNTITVAAVPSEPILNENGEKTYKYKPQYDDNGSLKLSGATVEGNATQAVFLLRTSSMYLMNEPEPVIYTLVPGSLDDKGYLKNDAAVNGPEGPVCSGLSNIIAMFDVESVEQWTEGKPASTIYQGWQTLSDNNRYYFDLDGKFVTGYQVIQGVAYSFNSNGVLQQQAGGQLRGVDVSTWQNPINWGQVRGSGIHFAMIRAGYRGYGSGVLVEDDKFRIHAQGAQAAGLRVGVYYFSQAINEREAIEEASAAIAIARKHGISVGYPIAIDIEYSNSARNGRADGISGATRTAVARAFCETVKNAGYTPMIYASKSWFENTNFLNISQLSSYRIWLAHWAEQTNYKGRIDMWQYTSSGSVPGISGRVDMNISYLGY